MRVKEYTVLVDCVERGVAYGMSRAYKYSDAPSEESIKSALIDAVLLEISEYFDFDNIPTQQITE
jgi:hypothetical protein